MFRLAAITFLLLFLAISLPVGANSSALPQGLTPVITFKVFDQKGKLLYTGRETIRLTSMKEVEKQTWYYDAQQKLEQKEVVRFNASNLITSYYLLENLKSGEKAELNTRAGKVRVAYRASAGEAMTTENLAWEKDMILGKSLHNLIIQKRATLAKGNPLEFSLLVPFKQQAFDFQVIAVKNTAKLVQYRLEPQSWMVRQFVEAMDFYYQKAPGEKLEYYEGPTTINTSPAEMIKIVFQYPPS